MGDGQSPLGTNERMTQAAQVTTTDELRMELAATQEGFTAAE